MGERAALLALDTVDRGLFSLIVSAMTGSLERRVEKAVKELGLTAYAAPKPAGALMAVKQPRIALVDKYGGVMPVGWTAKLEKNSALE